jgi:hypothetical protein
LSQLAGGKNAMDATKGARTPESAHIAQFEYLRPHAYAPSDRPCWMKSIPASTKPLAAWEEMNAAAFHLYELKLTWNVLRSWRWACRLSGLSKVAAGHSQAVRLDKFFRVAL